VEPRKQNWRTLRRLPGIVLLALALSIPGALSARAEDAVTVPDASLRACLADALSKEGIKTSLTATSLGQLRELDCSYGNTIGDLTGLEWLGAVREIQLPKTSVAAVGPLNKLTTLTTLTLVSTHDFALSPLTALTNLSSLWVSVGPTTDLAAIATFTKLDSLHLTTHGVSQLSALTTSSAVRALTITGDSSLTSLGTISGGTYIAQLSVTDAPNLRSLAAVRYLDGVVELNLQRTGISDIAELAGFPRITRANLDGTKLKSLVGVPRLASLTMLDISNTAVTDATPLATLPSLVELAAYNAQLATLGPRGSLSRLRNVRLPNNHLQTIEALDGAPLTTVYLDGNPLSDIRPLAGIAPDAWVGLGDTQVRDLSPLPDTVSVQAGSYHGIDLPSATVGVPVDLGLRGIDGTPLCPDGFWMYTDTPPPGWGTTTTHVTGADCSGGFATYPRSGVYYAWFGASSRARVSFSPNLIQHAGPDRPFDRTTTPMIGGQPMVGNPFMASAGGWAPTPFSYTYQWYRNGKLLTGLPDDLSAYTPTEADYGARFQVCITGHRDGYVDARRCSNVSGKVGIGGIQVFGEATIEGVRAPDSTLRLKMDVWPKDVTFHLQWQRDYTDIKGATHKTYKVQARDVGHRLRILVTLSKKLYSDYPTSTDFTKVRKATMSAGTPTIHGAATVGSQLSAAAGTWSAGAKLSYQWYRNGKAIKKATHRMYQLTGADRGKSIVVKVTGRKAGYTTVRRSSAATEKVS